jgi:hypothetical protein
LRAEAPELLKIATGKEARPPELDTFAAAFAVAGENQEKAADEETLVLLKRFSRNPAIEKAKAEFDRAQKVEEKFHHDFDGADFTKRKAPLAFCLSVALRSSRTRVTCCVIDPKLPPWVNEFASTLREVKIFLAMIFLAVWALLLSSCADLKLPPDQPWSNRHGRPGSGDCTFRGGLESEFRV